MPLAFQSVSHGEIVFGFFNIESDMLLLEQTFFFTDSFCRHVATLAGTAPDVAYEAPWPVRVIESLEDVGDLMDAIHGVRYTGFIGATYRRYPFPRSREAFRQNPEGHRTRDEFRELIAPFSVEREIRFRTFPESREIALGEVRFARADFHELIRYVWRGGWPRWRDEVRPPDVLALRDAVERGGNWATVDLRLIENDAEPS